MQDVIVGAPQWLYNNISTAHVQTVDQLKRWGAQLTPAHLHQIQQAFANVQAHATDPTGWQAVQNAHHVSYDVLRQTLGREPSLDMGRDLEAHFQRIGSWIPGGPKNFVSAIGQGVAAMAKATAKVFTVAKDAFIKVTQSPLWKVVAGAAIFIPGIGPAVSAGMFVAAKVGAEAAKVDAVVSATREQLPGGNTAKLGFDVAMGIIVQGSGMGATDLAAARAQLPDDLAKQAFDTAFATHVGRLQGQTAPKSIPLQARGAYYAEVGAKAVKAPPLAEQAIKNMTAVNALTKMARDRAIQDLQKGTAVEVYLRLRDLALRVARNEPLAQKTLRELQTKAQQGHEAAQKTLVLYTKARESLGPLSAEPDPVLVRFFKFWYEIPARVRATFQPSKTTIQL